MQVSVGVAEVADRDGDNRGEEEAVAETGAEDAEHPDRQIGEPDLGLEATVAVGVADFPRRVGTVEEVEHGAEDRRDPDRDDHPPDEDDFEAAGTALRLLAMDVDSGSEKGDRGEEKEGHRGRIVGLK